MLGTRLVVSQCGGWSILRGGGKGASCTAQHSEQPVGCVADGDGEWCRGSGPQERRGHSTCHVPLSTLKCREAALSRVWRCGGGWSRLRGGGKGTSCTAQHSEQPVGCVADGEGS